MELFVWTEPFARMHNAQGITEFTDQLPLIAGFASAYAEVNAEQTQKVTPSADLLIIMVESSFRWCKLFPDHSVVI